MQTIVEEVARGEGILRKHSLINRWNQPCLGIQEEVKTCQSKTQLAVLIKDNLRVTVTLDSSEEFLFAV